MIYKGYEICDDGFTPGYYILVSEFGPELGPYISEKEAMKAIDDGVIDQHNKKVEGWEWE